MTHWDWIILAGGVAAVYFIGGASAPKPDAGKPVAGGTSNPTGAPGDYGPPLVTGPYGMPVGDQGPPMTGYLSTPGDQGPPSIIAGNP